MKVTSIEQERVKSKATPEELAEAIQSLDLKAIPKDLRGLAILDRVMQVMTETAPFTEHHKEAFQSAQATRLAIKHNR